MMWQKTVAVFSDQPVVFYNCNCFINRSYPCEDFGNYVDCPVEFCQLFPATACFSNSLCEDSAEGYSCTCPDDLFVTTSANGEFICGSLSPPTQGNCDMQKKTTDTYWLICASMFSNLSLRTILTRLFLNFS